MGAIGLFFLAVLLFAAAALVSLLLMKYDTAARWLSGLVAMAASVAGCIAAAQAILGGTASFELGSLAALGHFTVHLDGFAALLIGVISLLAFATSLYSISYAKEYDGRGAGALGFFNNLFIAAMLMVVSVANAFYFLIFWETMTLASYFLVIFEQEKKESVSAGYLYFVIAHIGTALIMIAFLLLYKQSGSLDFAAFQNGSIPAATKNLVFLLAFFGFGAKAGIVPLHIWLPRAHPAAPSHVSALLSGVMIKTAIYGIIRIGADVLGAPAWWWGFIVILFGALSAVLGILYALDEHDLKRLLAYSSVENIGIILMGVGVGMMGMAIQVPTLTVLGFVAALYHVINHAVFKGLLFMGAGSVVYRTHTRNMNEMGGLARLMPWTSLLFLTGAVAIAAIPPLNGFVSEWFLYQSLFLGSTSDPGTLRIFGPIFAMVLGLVGAMVAMCFVKAYGTTFTGPARSQHAREAREAPWTMLIGMVILGVSIVCLGLGAPVVTPLLSRIAGEVAKVPVQSMASGVQVFPTAASQSALSTPFIFIMLLGLLTVPILAVLAFGGYRAGRKTAEDPWACGYGYEPGMSVSAGNFAQPMMQTYAPLYRLRSMMQKPLLDIANASRKVNSRLPDAEPVVERGVSKPIISAVQYVGRIIQRMQMGDVRIYCLYIFVALAVLLIVIFR